VALPGNVSTGTVTGTFLGSDGAPARGTVRFTAEAPYVLDGDADAILVSLTHTAELDVAGSFTVELVATDDANLLPVDFTYRVQPRVYGLQMPAFSIEVPSGSDQDLADIAPASGTGGTLPEGPLDPAVADLVPGPSLTHDALVTLIEDTAPGGGGGAVDSVNGHTGVVVLVKSDVGLSNVDNTTDAGKPVSTATATALAGKASTSHTHAQSDVTNLVSDLAGKASTSHTHTTSSFLGDGYPVAAYGLFAASVQPEVATSPGTIDAIWSVRLPVRDGQVITRAGIFINSAGSSLSGLCSFGLYDDAGTLITSTVSDATVFTSTGWQFKSFPSPVAAGVDRYVWLRVNVENHAGSFPGVSFRTGHANLDGGFSTHRRAFYNSSRVSAWPSTINPLTDGSSNGGYIPLMGLG
jgi:hypothetical protein